MPTRKRPPQALRDLCAQMHDDDGFDPRNWSRTDDRPYPPGGTSRKDLPRCKQTPRAGAAARALSAEPMLRELAAIAAEPAPDARRIRVVLAAPAAIFAGRERELRARLRAAQGYLRCAAAAATARKRAPQ